MAQIIAPEVWQEGIDDNRLLPGRYTTGLFTGSGVKIANNNEACRVWDMQVTDYITDYDDRRINGLIGPKQNTTGQDGWAASAYGVFQDVRFDSRVYTMGRHRSVAMRIFDEMQYAGDIGYWGDAATSSVITNGNALMKTAAILSKAKDIWSQQVLGPDIDRYNLFAVLNGHISGRWVQNNPDQIFTDDGFWIAQPGMVQGVAIPPRFAPIHAMEWDDDNIPELLQNLRVTWNNLFIPEDSRVILLDPFYQIRLMQALTGNGVPATEAAYSDIRDGNFTKLMGWDFRFDIPSQYWPRLYLDENLNVVHSANGQAPYDQLIWSTNHDADGAKKLMLELADADRMNRPNFVRTVWDATDGMFHKIVTNYPLGMPSASDYFGLPIEVAESDEGQVPDTDTKLTNADELLYKTYGLNGKSYPWAYPGAGYGFPDGATYGEGTITLGPSGTITRHQVIGLALYQKAAQLSQEYSSMTTDEGKTRGKFTEMVFDVKYDAWVIEGLSHGIIPIIDAAENTGVFAIPVKVVSMPETTKAEGEGGEGGKGGN